MKRDHAIRRMFEKIDAKEFEALSAWIDPQIVYERPGFDPVQGWDAFLNFYRHIRIIDSGIHVLDKILVAGDTAMSNGHFIGKKKDGTPVEVGFSELYRFNEAPENIVFRRTYFYSKAV